MRYVLGCELLFADVPLRALRAMPPIAVCSKLELRGKTGGTFGVVVSNVFRLA